MGTDVNQALEADTRERSTREMLSAFSGLAVLCILVAVLFAATFIGSCEGAQTAPLYDPALSTSRGNAAAVSSVTFYLLDSEARFEETREFIDLAADQVGQIPLQTYPRVVTLLARTPDEEALAYARIVEQIRSSEAEPQSVAVVDLRERKPK
jgi:hypothetical protein